MLRVAEVTVTESAWFAGRMKRRAANVIGRPVAFASVELDVPGIPGALMCCETPPKRAAAPIMSDREPWRNRGLA